MMWSNPAEMALNELSRAPLVRFSLLALSSIFFLVDPFAAVGSFLAITEGADPARRKRTARKAATTCFIVLTSFAVGGQFIFKLFGITLPAFEVAGGLILLLIGLDMLQAKRSATQETMGDAEEASHKEDAGIVPLGIPMLAGPQPLALADGGHPGRHSPDCFQLLLGAGRGGQSAKSDGRDRNPRPGEGHGTFVGRFGNAVLRQWFHGLRNHCSPMKRTFPTDVRVSHRVSACIQAQGLILLGSRSEVNGPKRPAACG
jgi:hypothetical protein